MDRFRRYIPGIIFLGVFVFIFSGSVITHAAESIHSFQVPITLQDDGTLLITENITYDFGGNERHGIFRDIPLTAENGPNLAITVLRVEDDHGGEYQFATSVENSIFHIKIGDPDVLVSGIRTYSINYEVRNAIRQFEDHDELYWNVTGNEWKVSIDKITAIVSLPDSLVPSLRLDCFTGQKGSVKKDCTFLAASSSSEFSTTRPLEPGDGLTIVLGVPKGYLHPIYVEPTPSEDKSNAALIFLGVIGFFFIFVFIMAIRSHMRKGKSQLPKEFRKEPVVVQYEPPTDLTPSDVGAIFDGDLDIDDLASVVVDLAVKGYLRIRYLEDDDYQFVKLKNDDDLAHPVYKMVFHFIFLSRETVKLSELNQMEASFDLNRAINEAKDYLEKKGYLENSKNLDPTRKRYYLSRYGLISGGVFVLSLVFSFSLSGGFSRLDFGGAIFLVFFSGLASLVASLFIIAIFFGRAIYGTLSPLGITTLKNILGFKEFLSLTEENKLKLLNAPELKPELFDRYLPFAMVLRVEKEWAKKFEGIYRTSPSWFEGRDGVFNPILFAGQMHSFGESFSQSTGTSSSGFSGGSSGGGSGGGGGGSW